VTNSSQGWGARLRALTENKALRWVLGLGIMLLSLWLLGRELDWAQVWAALQTVQYTWVLVGVLAIVGTFFARVWRWQALLWRADLPLWPTMTALLVGQVVNLALPVMRSGDVARAVWISPQRGADAPQALGSVALEKVWDLLALLICGILLLLMMPLPTWFTRSTWGTALTLAVGGVGLWVGLRWKSVWFRLAGRILARFPAGWDRALLPKLRSLAQGLTSLENGEASAKAFVWTLATWALGVAANWAVMAGFGIASLPAALLLMVGLMVGNAIVPTPARLGVFEGICVGCLALFAVPYDQALAVGLVLHLVVMGPPLLLGALLALGTQVRQGAGRKMQEPR